MLQIRNSAKFELKSSLVRINWSRLYPWKYVEGVLNKYMQVKLLLDIEHLSVTLDNLT